jgi:hypothetical protein
MIVKKLHILWGIILFVFLSNSSCNDSCPVNKVTLTNFWNETTNQNIGIDPLGGYIFFYWVDNNGNACHGEPGISGQPGPQVINAYSQEAYDAAVSNSFISEDRMKQLQQFIYANEKYHIKGSHFVQFDNIIWRSRADGKVFLDHGFHSFSKPVIVDPENTVCLTPVYIESDAACGKYSGLFLPNPLPGNQQHPSIGLSKIQPSNNTSESELLNYCIMKLPHGKEISE